VAEVDATGTVDVVEVDGADAVVVEPVLHPTRTKLRTSRTTKGMINNLFTATSSSHRLRLSSKYGNSVYTYIISLFYSILHILQHNLLVYFDFYTIVCYTYCFLPLQVS
jgi:hypothetical protein